ncbi:MAG TPA: outer membrane beta-barrel protein [Ramlibacter sp.]|jgi:opacity protein-like surface antigen|uniref:outer membrane beta-barrel protein n=1 Tax=Ramlibacter sp. TaxID=1917967 RepID=UPI002D23A9BA|nr:outer membrane beta-barrel protein [Ramlibacter sp.]HZY19696.1 outer membrane beta-barrel protein [Ramlibacter sp.]
MKQIVIAAASALLLLGTAQAQQSRPMMGMGSGTMGSGLYGEVGYTGLQIEGGGIDANPGMIRGIVGVDLHPNFAVEGMVGFGVTDDDSSVSTLLGPANVNTEVRHAYGVFIKPKADFGPVEAFARLGYSRFKIRNNVSLAGVSVSGSDTDGDVSYGLGANWRFSPRAYAGVDYMRYYKDNGTTIDGWTVSVGYRF